MYEALRAYRMSAANPWPEEDWYRFEIRSFSWDRSHPEVPIEPDAVASIGGGCLYLDERFDRDGFSDKVDEEASTGWRRSGSVGALAS